MKRIRRLIKNVPIVGPLMHRLYMSLKLGRMARRLQKEGRTPPVRIIVGASDVFEPDWIPTEVEFLNLMNPKDWEKYFDKASIDAILGEHVWEHLTAADGLRAAQHCFEYLKAGGYLRVAVPDGYHPDDRYIEFVRVGGSGPGADDHKVLYNCHTFRELFEKAGFRVELLEYYDAEGEFHYREWNPREGMIRRSKRFDTTYVGGETAYTSLVLDAIKPV